MRTNPTNSILALDTASPSPGVTLLRGAGAGAAAAAVDAPLPPDGRASERLLPLIEECFTRLELPLSSCERIAVCSGPGSFTGVRVGLATAWGLGRALGRDIEAVPTLEAMAEAARAGGVDRVAVALDAGRGEIVWQAFRLSGPRAAPIRPALRQTAAAAKEAAGDVPFACLPSDLLAFACVPLPVSLSRALAEAVARRPSAGPSSLAAIYSRPSAAEEKHGAS